MFRVRKEAAETLDRRIRERSIVQQGQVVKDNEGAKSQASKRNVLPQGDSQSVQDVVNKPVGNLDKPKKKNGNGRRKIVVKQ